MAFEHLSLYIQISEVFEPVSCSLWKSDPLLIFFYFHYINKNSFQKENRHYEIAAYLCYTWSIFWIFHDKTCIIHSFFSRKRVKSEMLSLFSRNEKWICFSFHSFREWKVKWKCLEIEIEKWNRKKILENSRETRLSQGTELSSGALRFKDQQVPKMDILGRFRALEGPEGARYQIKVCMWWPWVQLRLAN